MFNLFQPNFRFDALFPQCEFLLFGLDFPPRGLDPRPQAAGFVTLGLGGVVVPGPEAVESVVPDVEPGRKEQVDESRAFEDGISAKSGGIRVRR